MQDIGTVGVGADGLPEAKEDAYTIEWLTGPLVVKEGTTLTAEIFNSNGNPENIVLTTGTELTPKKTDGTTYVDAELSDGTMCRIHIETAEGFPHTIDGVDEHEYLSQFHTRDDSHRQKKGLRERRKQGILVYRICLT